MLIVWNNKKPDNSKKPDSSIFAFYKECSKHNITMCVAPAKNAEDTMDEERIYKLEGE
jgi:hypothetical protein